MFSRLKVQQSISHHSTLHSRLFGTQPRCLQLQLLRFYHNRHLYLSLRLRQAQVLVVFHIFRRIPQHPLCTNSHHLQLLMAMARQAISNEYVCMVLLCVINKSLYIISLSDVHYKLYIYIPLSYQLSFLD